MVAFSVHARHQFCYAVQWFVIINVFIITIIIDLVTILQEEQLL